MLVQDGSDVIWTYSEDIDANALPQGAIVGGTTADGYPLYVAANGDFATSYDPRYNYVKYYDGAAVQQGADWYLLVLTFRKYRKVSNTKRTKC